MFEPNEILNSFISTFIRYIGNNNLLISIADFKVFDSHLFTTASCGPNWEDNLNTNSTFDYILADLPYGMKKTPIKINGVTCKIKQNWHPIINSIKYLNDDGFGLFIMEPSILFSRDGERFVEVLKEMGCYITAVFNTPENILRPYSGMRPVLVTIRKKKTKLMYVGEINAEDRSDILAENYLNQVDTRNIDGGTFVHLENFKGFDQFRAQIQLEGLESQYNNYKKHQLKEYVLEMKIGSDKAKLVEHKNSIYIPRLGLSNPVCSLSELKIKEQNYYQIVLNDSINNKYLAAMFKSDLGRLLLRMIESGTVIKQRNKKELLELYIPVPNIKIQNQISSTLDKLGTLKKAIEVFDKEIALNPTSSLQIVDRIDQIIGVLGELTEADYIRNIIRKGETKSVEFKETFSLDVVKNKKEKYIETSALKTIIGFLNTEGGVLLIGVSDDGQIKGINTEIEKFYNNKDKYKLHFKNSIRNRIGEQFYPLLNYRIVDIDGKLVLIVECEKSEMPCFLDEKDFYVRTNPATDKLEGSKQYQYIQNHFN